MNQTNPAFLADPFDRSREMLVLTAIAAAVAQSLEIEPLLINALDHIIDLLEMDAGGIWTHTGADRFELVVHRGLDMQVLDPYRSIYTGVDLIGQIAAQAQTQVIAEIENTTPMQSLLRSVSLRAMVGVPLLARGNVVGVLVVFREIAYTFPARTVRLLEAAADHVALALDNARLFAAEQQRRRQSEALRHGALALTEAIGLGEVLGRIVDQAMSLMEAPMCAIYELSESGKRLRVGMARGLPPEYTLHSDIPWGGFAVGRAVAEQHTIAYTTPEECAAALTEGSSADLPFASLLAVPLIVKGQVYGGIAVYYSQPRSFSGEESDLLRIFAHQAALALEHARLVEQSRQLAGLQERQRLARELHDSVSQTLFSLKLAAQAAQTTLNIAPSEASSLLSTVQELATAALAEMRALLFELRPTALREAGLHAALSRQTAAFTARTGVPVVLKLDDCDPPPAIEEALYRIAGEALANIGRHAQANHVQITLEATRRSICLRVTDDGVGFDPKRRQRGDHMGQHTMLERAEALGGTLYVQSEPGQGTIVSVEVPLSPQPIPASE